MGIVAELVSTTRINPSRGRSLATNAGKKVKVSKTASDRSLPILKKIDLPPKNAYDIKLKICMCVIVDERKIYRIECVTEIGTTTIATTTMTIINNEQIVTDSTFRRTRSEQN